MTNICRPMLALALNLIETRLLAAIIIVGSAEVMPVVLLGRILVTTSGEIETQPAINLEHIRHLLVAVVWINFDNPASFGLVCPRCCSVSSVDKTESIVLPLWFSTASKYSPTPTSLALLHSSTSSFFVPHFVPTLPF